MIFDTDFLIAYGKGTKALSKAKARAYVDASILTIRRPSRIFGETSGNLMCEEPS